MFRVTYPAIALAIAVLFTGCGSSPPDIVPVQGVVTLNGVPLPDVEVRFLPLIQGFGGEYTATGITDENGRFVLNVLGREGACAVLNHVCIEEAPLPEEARGMSAKSQTLASKILGSRKNRPIPNRYTTFAQSPLKIEVSSQKQDYSIELTR